MEQRDDASGGESTRWSELRGRFSRLRQTPFHPQWLLVRGERRALEDVAARLKGIVLDIGCAHQRLRAFLPGGTEYFGLDYPAISTVRYGTTADVFGDAQALPFRSGSLDSVVLLDVLEHLPRPERCIAEVARVLKPGGRVVIQVPFLYPLHDVPYDFQRWTIHGLRRILEGNGLRILSEEAQGSPFESAGLLLSLALARSGLRWIEDRRASVLLLPLVALAIPLVNVSAWALGAGSRQDGFMPHGYRIVGELPA